MFKIARRFNSNQFRTVVTTHGADPQQKLISAKPFDQDVQENRVSRYQLADYSHSQLTSFYREGGVCIPSETVRAKLQEQDYEYFLQMPNFLKVVSTLDRFESELVVPDSDEAKALRVFKRDLYEMYEVRNRSVAEHKQISMVIDRRSLNKLYKANLQYQF